MAKNRSAPELQPVRSTTAEAVLGMLSLRPMSGYDIRQAIEGSTANFWSESFGQIYPALKRLTDDGLVSMEEQQPEGQRLRKEYRLTAAGRTRLREWLAQPCGQQVRREELLLKLFFGEKAPKGAMRKAVAQRLAAAEAELAHYGEIERGLVECTSAHPSLPYWRMTLEFGRLHAAATKGWCERTLAELDALASDRRKPRGGKHHAR